MKRRLLSRIMLLLCALIVGSGSAWGQSWVKTDITSLSDGDVVVVLETAKYNRALLNTEATSSGSVKASSEVTLSADGSEITSLVNTNIQWVFGGSSTSFTLKSNDDAERQLWCRDNNDALRVKASSPGTAYRGTFTWDNDYKMMKSTEYTRYAGIWKNGDTDYQWRAYNSQTSNNIKGCETSFYKYTSTGKTATTTTIDDSGLTNIDIYISTSAGQLTASVTAGGSAVSGATVSWSSNDENVATVDANGNVTLVSAGTATITAFYAGNDDYNASSATYDLTVENNDPTIVKAIFDFSTNQYSWDSTSEGSTYFDGSGYNATEGNITIGFSGKVRLWESSGSYTMRFYSDDTYGRGKMTLTAADGYVITGVSITGSTLSFQNPSSGTINGGEWTTGSEKVKVLTIEKGSSTSNFYKVEVSYTIDTGLPTPTVTIDAAGITNTDVYAGTAAGNLSATVTYNSAAVSGATVTWSGNNDAVATIDASTGAVTLVAAGTVTFTAVFAGNSEYDSATETYEMTVTNSDPNQPGTENNPYTVAQARAAIDAGTGVTGVYATGIVSEIVTAYNSQYGNITYNISVDGTKTADQLQAYRGKGKNGDNFTSEDDIQVGDVVVIYGNLKKYNSIYEFDQDNELVSLTRPATPSITLSTTSIDAPATGKDGTITVTYNNITSVVAEVKFCDVNGNDANYDWVTAYINNENNIEYLIGANTGDARTAYMKVYALDDDTNDVYSELITINQEAYVAPAVTIGNFVKVTNTADITSGQYLIVYENDGVDGVAFDGSLPTLDASNNVIDVTINNGEIIATTTNAQSVFTIDVAAGTLQSASGKYIGVSTNSNGLKTSDDATTYKNKFSIDDSGNVSIEADFDGSNRILLFNSSTSSGNYRFRYYGGTSATNKDIQLYKFVPSAAAVPVTISSVGYRTYCSTIDLDFSNTGITAYKAIVSNNEVKFEEIKQVPAGEGVLLKAGEGPYDVPVAAYAAANSDNAFIGVIAETTITTDPADGIYVLMNKSQGVGFYKTTGSTFTLGANTAYLPAMGSTARSFIGFGDDTTTGINNVNVNLNDNNVYDLQGRKVNGQSSMVNGQLKKGLYIVNGKKVVIK